MQITQIFKFSGFFLLIYYLSNPNRSKANCKLSSRLFGSFCELVFLCGGGGVSLVLLTLFGGHPTGTPGLQLFFSHIYNYSARAPIDLYAEPVATLLKPKPKKRLRNRIEISWIVERRKTRTETERNWDRYWNREWVHSVNLPVPPIRMYSLAYPTLETRLGYTPLPSQVRQCDAGLASSSRSFALSWAKRGSS